MSDMISEGSLSSFQLSFRKESVTSFAVAFLAKPINWAIFVKPSTTTMLWVCPWDSGNWVIQSTEVDVLAA